MDSPLIEAQAMLSVKGVAIWWSYMVIGQPTYQQVGYRVLFVPQLRGTFRR